MGLRNEKNLTIGEIQEASGVDEVDLELAKCRLETITTFKEKIARMKQGLKLLMAYILRIILYTFVAGSTYIVYDGVTYNSGKIG